MASKASDRKPETENTTEDQNKASGGGSTATATKSAGEESDAQGGKSSKSAGQGKDAVELIKEDHRRVEKLFDQFKQSRNFNQKKRLVEQICIELNTHTLVEEQIFYPACRGKVEDDLLDEAQVEHDGCKQLIVELQNSSPADQYYEAKVTVLSEYVKHHVGEEEKAGEGILDAARKAGVDLAALGREIEQRRPELQQQAIDDPEPDMPSMDEGRQQGSARGQQSRGSYASQGGYGRDQGQGQRNGGRQGSGSQGSGWHGDPEGHARAGRQSHEHDDDRRYTSQSRGGGSRRDDDDHRGGRGQGGWFGDPEGHSQAARRGAAHRGSQEDDEYGYAQSRRDNRYRDEDEDDRRGGERDRGQGGWFGDSEGHAQAARRGAQHRGGYEDDDRQVAASQGGGRYENEDDRGGRSGGERYR